MDSGVAEPPSFEDVMNIVYAHQPLHLTPTASPPPQPLPAAAGTHCGDSLWQRRLQCQRCARRPTPPLLAEIRFRVRSAQGRAGAAGLRAARRLLHHGARRCDQRRQEGLRGPPLRGPRLAAGLHGREKKGIKAPQPEHSPLPPTYQRLGLSEADNNVLDLLFPSRQPTTAACLSARVSSGPIPSNSNKISSVCSPNAGAG